MKNKFIIFLLSFFALTTLFQSPVLADDYAEIMKVLNTYHSKISKDYTFESDISESTGFFTTEGSPRIYVNVYFSKSNDSIEGRYEEYVQNGVTIYRFADEPKVYTEENIIYNPIAYAFCGEYRILISSTATFANSDLIPQYTALMNTYSYDYLVDMVNTSSLCGVKEKSIFEDIQIVITSITGDVEISRGGVDNYVPAKVGDTLIAGDYIATGFESTADFTVKNIATLTVNQMTNFSVSQLQYDGNLARTAINLRMGEVTTNVKPEKGVKASFQIVTPTSTIGVRGTQFTTVVDRDSQVTRIYVYEGSVSVTNNGTGEEDTVNTYQTAYISSQGDVEISEMDEDSVINEYHDYERTPYLSIIGISLIFILFILGIVFIIKKKILLGIISLVLSFLVLITVILLLLFSSQTPTTQIEEPSSNKYIVNNQFTVDLGSNYESIEFYQEVENAYVACYIVGDNNEYSGACPLGSVEVFRITLYETEMYQEVVLSPTYINSYIALEEFEDGSAYVLEWPNGMYPEQVSGIDMAYFENIANSFEITL